MRFGLVPFQAFALILLIESEQPLQLQAAEVPRAIGVARIDVTPTSPIRLTGYASRKTNSVGVEQKLWAKALAIGSDREGPALLLTLDNCGIAEDTYLELVARLSRKGIRQDHLAIACSHTHTGPCTTRWAPNIFAQDIPTEQQATIDQYTRELIDKLERVALAALADRRPGQLAWSEGKVGFARNRRVVVGNTAQFGESASGPVDHALPVLLATDTEGKVRGIVANYACHCTTVGGEVNKITGDWAGHAQEAIERDHPGAIALITIGCGADANPSPRGGADGGLALARQHGEELAAEVKRLLSQNFKPLPGRLTAKLKRINLPFGPHFTRAQWEARAREEGINGYHARKWLARLDRGGKPPDTLPYYIETWNFGEDLALVFLNGEVVVDYALRLKREFDGTRLWVTSYANYVPCYIPSRRILAEGGYEAESSLWYYDRPARLSTNAEDLIIRTVTDLLPKSFRVNPKKARLPDPKPPLQALGTFRTHSNLTVELVASEPLIESPVAIDWDAQGRLWVCEMYDYPTGITPPADPGHKYGEPIRAPRGGFTPGGRIKVLSSTKHDGHYDKATLFLDKLAFPTGVMPWRKGALICAAPDILYAEDTDGDGRADLVRTNFTGFATHNFQARVNGFRWGLDGWLHASSGLFGGKIKSVMTGREVDLGGRDFRIKPDTGEIEPLAGVSQMGRVRDDFDNWFGNDNSTLLWHYPLPDHYLRRNPYVTYPDPRVNVAAHRGAVRSSSAAQPGIRISPALADPNQLFPISRTFERFNDPQAANRVTSACGIDIYRDYLLGAGYYGNAFICEPVHNLIHRLVLEPDGVTFAGRRAEEEQRGEFLASTDNWFRPVQARTGPDGALWVVDMYRFVVEHPRWIAPERLKELDVRAGADMGRIYRVYAKGAKLRPIQDLTTLPFPGLANSLYTFNGPNRDRIHMEMLQRASSISALQTKTSHSTPRAKRERSTPSETVEETMGALDRLTMLSEGAGGHGAAQVQALSLQRQLDDLPPSRLEAALTNNDLGVRRFAIRLLHPDWESKSASGTNFLAGSPVGERGMEKSSTSIQPLKERMAKLIHDVDSSVRFQAALSFGYWPDRLIASWLASLASDNDPWIRAAVLSSATHQPAEILKQRLALSARMDGKLVADLLATAAHAPKADDWQEMLRTITPGDGRPTQPWQWSALASLLDALQLTQVTADSLASSNQDADRAAAGRIRKVLAAARDLAVEASADETTREGAIRLLAHAEGHNPDALGTLVGFVQPGTSARLQSAALESLRRQRGQEVALALLKQWTRTSPSARATLINLLLSRDEWTDELLRAAGQGTVAPGEISLAQRERLLQHKSASLREQAARLFAATTSGNRAEVLARYQSVAAARGAAGHGAEMFGKNCAQCHAFRGQGHAVGPNLAEFAGKAVADFLVAILDPNAAIEPKSVAYNVETQDGRSLTGLVRNETASSLTLLQGGGVEERILRSDVKEIRASPLSLMPEGLEQTLTPQDLADLIAWLKQGAPAPFGGADAARAAQARMEFSKGGSNGLAKILAGAEELPYPSWLGRLPMPYCRQDGGKLSWQTSPVVFPGQESPMTFRLPAAMGFISQPQGRFTLKLNGQRMLDFDVTLTDQAWTSADGLLCMSYSVMENNTEDSNGVLMLEVSSALVTSGQPIAFEVIGSSSNSQRWFGLYRLVP